MNGEIRNKLNKSFARKARNAVACKAEQLGDLVVTCALAQLPIKEPQIGRWCIFKCLIMEKLN